MRPLNGFFVLEVRPEMRQGRGRWWCPREAGYTSLIAWAGLYSEDEAVTISRYSDRAAPVPAEEALAVAIAEARRGGDPCGFERMPFRDGSVGAALGVDIGAVVLASAGVAGEATA